MIQDQTFVNSDSEGSVQPRFRALIPFIVFLVFYMGLSVWAKFDFPNEENYFYKVPMPVAFLVASAVALILNHKEKFMKKVELYAKGMGDIDIMIMCLIFILAGAFATLAKSMGAVEAAVAIAQSVIPPKLMLAGLFLVSCFISLAIGTSCGTIAALTPIAVGLSQIGFPEGLAVGAVVGGAMFGDNMSLISDTTIAATRTQNIEMRDKFITNIRMVLPAAVITLIIYVMLSGHAGSMAHPVLTWVTFLKVSPYILLIVLALIGFNVMSLLFFGSVLAAVIGIFTNSLTFWDALGQAGAGTMGMSETLIVALLAGGMLKIIRANGGISFLLLKLGKMIRGKKTCEFGVFLLVSIVNLFTANNTVAIVIAGPIARNMSLKYHCDPKRIASILDIASCVVQGIIPYGAQILIAIGIASVSSFEIIECLFYPYLMGISVLIFIAFSRQQDDKKKLLRNPE